MPSLYRLPSFLFSNIVSLSFYLLPSLLSWSFVFVFLISLSFLNLSVIPSHFSSHHLQLIFRLSALSFFLCLAFFLLSFLPPSYFICPSFLPFPSHLSFFCFTFYCLSTLSLFTPSRLPLSFLPFLSSLLGFLLPFYFSSFRLPTLSFFHPTSFVFLTYFLHATLRSLISCCLHSFSFLPRPVFCFPSLIPFLPSYFILSSFKPYVFFPFSFLLCFPSFLLYFSSFCHAIFSFCCFFPSCLVFLYFPCNFVFFVYLSFLPPFLPSYFCLSSFTFACTFLSLYCWQCGTREGNEVSATLTTTAMGLSGHVLACRPSFSIHSRLEASVQLDKIRETASSSQICFVNI